MRKNNLIFEIVKEGDAIVWSLGTFGLKGYANIRKISIYLNGWRQWDKIFSNVNFIEFLLPTTENLPLGGFSVFFVLRY